MKCRLSFCRNENCPTSSGFRLESTVKVQRDCSNWNVCISVVSCLCVTNVGISTGVWWDGMQWAHVIKLRSLLWELVCVLWSLSASLRLWFTAGLTGKSAKKCFNCTHSMSKMLYIPFFEQCNNHDNVISLLLRIFVAMNETLSFGPSEFCHYWSSSEAAGWWLQLKWS